MDVKDQQVEEYEEKKIFAHMVKYHSPQYYQGLFNNKLDWELFRGLPIRTKNGDTKDADYDNCIDSPPNYPIDPDYSNRYCIGGYYCKMSNRKWGCRYSVPKSPTKTPGFNPK